MYKHRMKLLIKKKKLNLLVIHEWCEDWDHQAVEIEFVFHVDCF